MFVVFFAVNVKGKNDNLFLNGGICFLHVRHAYLQVTTALSRKNKKAA
jgi:hypothetical protein